MNRKKIIKVLIVDDSAYNRRAIGDFLVDIPEIEIVAKACDGQEGLQLALNENPDVITLDLEMPKLNGFNFLKLIMAIRATPVIVISSHNDKDSVFKALEYGAVDFVAKPTHAISHKIYDIKKDVIEKILMAGNMRSDSLLRLSSLTPQMSSPEPLPASSSLLIKKMPIKQNDSVYIDQRDNKNAQVDNSEKLVVIAASTGGPQAITQILCELSKDLQVGIVIVQHMPPQFTTTFSLRLNKQCSLLVKELYLKEQIQKGTVYIAPGDKNLEFANQAGIKTIFSKDPDPNAKFCPSADQMFASAAKCFGSRILAIVLTGMGDDGALGSKAIFESGGSVLVESPDEAIVNGMPRATIETGIKVEKVNLNDIAKKIINFAQNE